MTKSGKTLRLGCTTGTCAAAAAKAAACALLIGLRLERVEVVTPKGIRAELQVKVLQAGEGEAVCAVVKDESDDPDVTRGAEIVAAVRRTGEPGIRIDGGAGVGRVTRPGLDQPVGAAAINSVPRRMIRACVEEIQALAGDHGGLSVVISVPEGEVLARRTFNPRMGIVGGISILGTTGVVEPMSEQALIGTIRVELRQRRESGAEFVLLTPGNYGVDFIRDGLGLPPELAVQCSNFIGDALDLCRELEFRGALLVGHVGKLVKLAGGMFNTHSRCGDCRMELLAAHAAAAGLPGAQVNSILRCVACDDALRLLQNAGVCSQTLCRLTGRIAFHLCARAGDQMETAAILFSKVHGLLGQTVNAERLLEAVRGGSFPL